MIWEKWCLLCLILLLWVLRYWNCWWLTLPFLLVIQWRMLVLVLVLCCCYDEEVEVFCLFLLMEVMLPCCFVVWYHCNWLQLFSIVPFDSVGEGIGIWKFITSLWLLLLLLKMFILLMENVIGDERKMSDSAIMLWEADDTFNGDVVIIVPFREVLRAVVDRPLMLIHWLSTVVMLLTLLLHYIDSIDILMLYLFCYIFIIVVTRVFIVEVLLKKWSDLFHCGNGRCYSNFVDDKWRSVDSLLFPFVMTDYYYSMI